MLSKKLQRTRPARILICIYLVGLPLFTLLDHLMLSHPEATADSAAAWLIPIKCPVNWLTGYLCPTCGLGRSVLLSLNGELSQALEFHFLGPLVASSLWLFYVYLLIPAAAKTALKAPAAQLLSQLKLRPSFYALVVTLYFLWGFARNFGA